MIAEAAVVADRNNDGFEGWMRQFRPWVQSRVRKWKRLGGVDPQDLEQIAWLGLVEALRGYQPDRGPFEPWARGVMRRRIEDAVKSAQRVKHRLVSDALTLTLEDGQERVGATNSDPFEILAERDRLVQFERLLMSALTPLELAVLRAMLHGFKGSAIAKAIGVPPKTSDNAQQRLRSKARAIWAAIGSDDQPIPFIREAIG